YLSDEVIEAGAKVGHSRDLLFRAKKALGITSKKNPFDRTGQWWWGLGPWQTWKRRPQESSLPGTCTLPTPHDGSNSSAHGHDPDDPCRIPQGSEESEG